VNPGLVALLNDSGRGQVPFWITMQCVVILCQEIVLVSQLLN